MSEKLELGFAAIGGKEWQQSFCECDPDTGHVPCCYCAEFDALHEAERLEAEVERLSELPRLQQRIERLREALEAAKEAIETLVPNYDTLKAWPIICKALAK